MSCCFNGSYWNAYVSYWNAYVSCVLFVAGSCVVLLVRTGMHIFRSGMHMFLVFCLLLFLASCCFTGSYWNAYVSCVFVVLLVRTEMHMFLVFCLTLLMLNLIITRINGCKHTSIKS